MIIGQRYLVDGTGEDGCFVGISPDEPTTAPYAVFDQELQTNVLITRSRWQAKWLAFLLNRAWEKSLHATLDGAADAS